MNRLNSLALLCAIALTVGCSTNKMHRQQKHDMNSPMTESDARSGEETASIDTTSGDPAMDPAPAPSVDHPLAGAWSLAIPRQNQQSASITAKDGDHITINAGENLSGEYVVQGQYLLILTRDEKLRPLAWRINTNDSLTVVRPPNLGEGATDYTGVTLVRAADDSANGEDAAASTDSRQSSAR
jgi:hypothetical protein